MPRLLLALLIAIVPALAADPDLSAFLPANPAMVMGGRLRALFDSDLFKGGAAQSLSLDPQWKQMAASLGFDPLRDLDEIMIATSGTGQNPPTLLAARGRFNGTRSSRTEPYHGIPLLDAGSGSVIAVLDEATALLGDAAEVRAAIDRRETGTTLDGESLKRIAALRTRYDIWGYGGKPADFVPAGTVAGGLEGVDRFEFGITWSRGLELSAELHMANPKDAGELSGFLQAMEGMLKTQQPSLSGTRFKVGVEASTLRIALAVPEEELKKAMVSRTVQAAPARTAASKPVTVKPAAPAPAPQSAAPKAAPASRPLTISVPVQPAQKGSDPATVRLPGGR
jgi:hypothetical protein